MRKKTSKLQLHVKVHILCTFLNKSGLPKIRSTVYQRRIQCSVI